MFNGCSIRCTNIRAKDIYYNYVFSATRWAEMCLKSITGRCRTKRINKRLVIILNDNGKIIIRIATYVR